MRTTENSAARITDDAINKSRNERQKSLFLGDVVHRLEDTTIGRINKSLQLVITGREFCGAGQVSSKFRKSFTTENTKDAEETRAHGRREAQERRHRKQRQ